MKSICDLNNDQLKKLIEMYKESCLVNKQERSGVGFYEFMDGEGYKLGCNDCKDFIGLHIKK